MNEFIALRKDEEKLCEAMKKFDPEFGYFSLGRYENLFINTLKEAINDKHDNIDYWIYDLNFGKNAKPNSITNKNGKEIPIKTLDNLYDLIAKDIT